MEILIGLILLVGILFREKVFLAKVWLDFVSPFFDRVDAKAKKLVAKKDAYKVPPMEPRRELGGAMRSMWRVLFMALACASACSAVVAGETVSVAVYKWVDTKGIVHYGDRPAPSESKPMSEKSLSSASLSIGGNQAIQEKNAIDARNEAKKRREAAGKGTATDNAAADESRLKACASAKEVARTLASGGRIGTVNEKGERVFLEEDEIQKRVIEANKNMDDACSPPKTEPKSGSEERKPGPAVSSVR